MLSVAGPLGSLPRLLVMAFYGGASVAVLASIVLEHLLEVSLSAVGIRCPPESRARAR